MMSYDDNECMMGSVVQIIIEPNKYKLKNHTVKNCILILISFGLNSSKLCFERKMFSINTSSALLRGSLLSGICNSDH